MCQPGFRPQSIEPQGVRVVYPEGFFHDIAKDVKFTVTISGIAIEDLINNVKKGGTRTISGEKGTMYYSVGDPDELVIKLTKEKTITFEKVEEQES